jgi:TetR/AcrR family transcriptional regulator, mexJK operon transcriptional repressor
MRAFLAEGYAAVSMSRIATTLGSSKGTLYLYFSSKEKLFAAAIERICKVAGGGYVRPDPDSDLRVQLHSLGMQSMRLLLSDDMIAAYRLVTGVSARFPEAGGKMYEAGPRQMVHRIAEFLLAGMEAGHFRCGDTTIAAQQFIDFCGSGMHCRRLWNVDPTPSEETIRAHVDRAVATFLAVYATDGAPGARHLQPQVT